MVLAWRRAPGSATSAWSKERFCAGDRAEGLVGVLGQGGEVGAALGHGGDDVGAVDEEVGEGPLVAVELLEQAIRRDQRGTQVLVGLVRLGAVAGVDRRRALDDVAEGLALRAAQRVEELVEVDRAGRVDLGDGRVVPQLRVVVRTRLDRDVAVGDPRERGRADDRRGALVERAG